MKMRSVMLAAVGAVIGVTGVVEVKNAYAAEEQFFPLLVYRTGPYAPSGIPVANGFRDYYDMLNKRDGGINGVIPATSDFLGNFVTGGWEWEMEIFINEHRRREEAWSRRACKAARLLQMWI